MRVQTEKFVRGVLSATTGRQLSQALQGCDVRGGALWDTRVVLTKGDWSLVCTDLLSKIRQDPHFLAWCGCAELEVVFRTIGDLETCGHATPGTAPLSDLLQPHIQRIPPAVPAFAPDTYVRFASDHFAAHARVPEYLHDALAEVHLSHLSTAGVLRLCALRACSGVPISKMPQADAQRLSDVLLLASVRLRDAAAALRRDSSAVKADSLSAQRGVAVDCASQLVRHLLRDLRVRTAPQGTWGERMHHEIRTHRTVEFVHCMMDYLTADAEAWRDVEKSAKRGKRSTRGALPPLSILSDCIYKTKRRPRLVDIVMAASDLTRAASPSLVPPLLKAGQLFLNDILPRKGDAPLTPTVYGRLLSCVRLFGMLGDRGDHRIEDLSPPLQQLFASTAASVALMSAGGRRDDAFSVAALGRMFTCIAHIAESPASAALLRDATLLVKRDVTIAQKLLSEPGSVVPLLRAVPAGELAGDVLSRMLLVVSHLDPRSLSTLMPPMQATVQHLLHAKEELGGTVVPTHRPSGRVNMAAPPPLPDAAGYALWTLNRVLLRLIPRSPDLKHYAPEIKRLVVTQLRLGIKDDELVRSVRGFLIPGAGQRRPAAAANAAAAGAGRGAREGVAPTGGGVKSVVLDNILAEVMSWQDGTLPAQPSPGGQAAEARSQGPEGPEAQVEPQFVPLKWSKAT